MHHGFAHDSLMILSLMILSLFYDSFSLIILSLSHDSLNGEFSLFVLLRKIALVASVQKLTSSLTRSVTIFFTPVYQKGEREREREGACQRQQLLLSHCNASSASFCCSQRGCRHGIKMYTFCTPQNPHCNSLWRKLYSQIRNFMIWIIFIYAYTHGMHRVTYTVPYALLSSLFLKRDSKLILAQPSSVFMHSSRISSLIFNFWKLFSRFPFLCISINNNL